MKYKLKNIFDLQMGKTPSRNNTNYWNTNDYEWISIADLSKTEKYITDTKEYLSTLAIEESGIKVIPANTVVMSFKLSIGKTAITGKDMYCNEAIMAFHDKHVVDILPEYIYYMFKYRNWDNGSNKAVMGKTLNKSTLPEVEIDICSIEKQKEIVTVLDKVMESLSSRKKELALFDELVRGRFVELFGDPSTNPRGWMETTVGDECFYIKDGPHKSLPDIGKENGGHPFISVRNIVNGYIDFSTARYISDEDFAEAINKCNPEKGDMLYSKGGTTGIAKLIDIDEEFANWVHVAVLKFDKTKLNGIFFENMLNGAYCYEQSQRLTKGIANKDLVLSAIAKIKMYIPPIKLQNQFADFVKQIDKSKFRGFSMLTTMKSAYEQQTLIYP
mgnify:FL=1